MSQQYPFVDIQVAQQLYAAGRPFTVSLQFVGRNSGNASGYSNKWWRFTFYGTGPTVSCNHGKAGSKGRVEPFKYTMQEAVDKCYEKLGKGYDYIPATQHQVPRTPAPAPSHPPIRLDGVFAEIRRIQEVKADTFEAYDGLGNYLLDLTESGTDQVMSADPFRVTVTRLAS